MMPASVTMGISVDDTIHFLARLRVVFNEKGNYNEALRETMHEVGIPLVITSLALVVAFSSYLLSDLLILSSFGVLLCISVIVGVLVELLLTPTLMGKVASMNRVAVFVGLLFWSWAWGVWGLLLAVPMMMSIKVICDHVDDLKPVGRFLGE